MVTQEAFSSCYHINDVLNRQKNRSAEPTTTVAKKDMFLVLPYFGFQSEALARRVKSCISKFSGGVNLRVIFQNTCRIKSFFPYKDRFSCSQRSKIVYKASCWDYDSSYIGKTKLHKSVTPLLLQTILILFLPVITSNGTILKSSLLESLTCSVKSKNRS